MDQKAWYIHTMEYHNSHRMKYSHFQLNGGNLKKLYGAKQVIMIKAKIGHLCNNLKHTTLLKNYWESTNILRVLSNLRGKKDIHGMGGGRKVINQLKRNSSPPNKVTDFSVLLNFKVITSNLSSNFSYFTLITKDILYTFLYHILLLFYTVLLL